MPKLYTIKPLEWVEDKDTYIYYADTPLGHYQIRQLMPQRTAGEWLVVVPTGCNPPPCRLLEDGKRLVEEHWQARLAEHLIEIDNTEEVGDE